MGRRIIRIIINSTATFIWVNYFSSSVWSFCYRKLYSIDLQYSYFAELLHLNRQQNVLLAPIEWIENSVSDETFELEPTVESLLPQAIIHYSTHNLHQILKEFHFTVPFCENTLSRGTLSSCHDIWSLIVRISFAWTISTKLWLWSSS